MRQLLIGTVMIACAVAVSATPIGVAGTNYDPTNLINVSGITVTGILSSASAVDVFTFEVTSAGGLTIQSWGYGGTAGATAFGSSSNEDLAGNVVAAGGFQPALTLYDSSNNLIADSGTGVSGFAGECPPAVSIFYSDAFTLYCGDPQLAPAALTPGAYTLDIAAEQGSFAQGVLLNPPFPEGTGTSNYTVDIEGAVALQQQTPPPLVTPEPATWALMGAGMLLLFFYWRRRPAVINDATRW